MKSFNEIEVGDVITFEDSRGGIRNAIVEEIDRSSSMTEFAAFNETLFTVDEDGAEWDFDLAEFRQRVLTIQ